MMPGPANMQASVLVHVPMSSHDQGPHRAMIPALQEVTRALEGAAQLGWEPARLASTLEAARARDARMAADLKALASAAPFDPAAFDALAAKAAGMGLKGDVAAARAVLDRRRRQMAGALGAKAEVAVAEGAAALQGGYYCLCGWRWGCAWFGLAPALPAALHVECLRQHISPSKHEQPLPTHTPL